MKTTNKPKNFLLLNTATIFVNKIVDGKPNMEGLCLACAKEKGLL